MSKHKEFVCITSPKEIGYMATETPRNNVTNVQKLKKHNFSGD